MERLGAAERVLVDRGETSQTLAPTMLAEARAFEHAVVGEAVEPFIVAAVVDGVRVARVELANLLAILDEFR